jgi:hypothetical protein
MEALGTHFFSFLAVDAARARQRQHRHQRGHVLYRYAIVGE